MNSRRSRIHGEGSIGTTDGSLPPILEKLIVWFDKHGEVVTKGLPLLHEGQAGGDHLEDRAQGLRGIDRRRGAAARALIAFPEQRPFKASSPITIFNAPPHNGNPTVLAHAYLSVPAPTTYIVPVEIQKDQQRAVRVPHRSEDPADRGRLRDPARRQR